MTAIGIGIDITKSGGGGDGQNTDLNIPTLTLELAATPTHVATEGDDLVALVTVDDGDGGTTSDVELYVNGVLIGSMTDDGGGDWSLAVDNVTAGNKNYRAKRITDLGFRWSPFWLVSVGASIEVVLDAVSEPATASFTVTVESAPSLEPAVAYMKRGENITLGGTMRATAGTSPPTLTLTGTLSFATGCPGLRVIISSTAGGTARGQALFDVSYDNGATWAHTGVTTAATYALDGAASGITLNFPVGTYNTDQLWQGTVQTWTSSEGDSHTFTNATAAQQPIYEVAGMDGEPCLLFGTGTNERLVSTNAAVYNCLQNQSLFTLFYKVAFTVADATGTVFGVGNSANGGTNKRRFGQTNTGTGRHLHQFFDTAGTSGNLDDAANPGASTSSRVVEWFTPAAGSGGTITLLVDGAATGITGAAAATGTLTPNQAAIGINIDSSPDLPLVGRVGSLALFDSELSSGDRIEWRAEIEDAA